MEGIHSKDVSLRELSDRLAEFTRARGWDSCHIPRNLVLALVGELCKLFQWRGEASRGLPDWSPHEKERLEERLSEVVLCLIRLADVCGLDLGRAALRKIAKNKIKYPVGDSTHP